MVSSALMIDIYDELRRLVQGLEAKGVRYALCGGLAMAVHGRPRATMDIDFLVAGDEIGAAVAVAESSATGARGSRPTPAR